MSAKYYWLSIAEPTAGGQPQFLGVVILETVAADIDGAIREAQALGHVPTGAICKGGPLHEFIVPPEQYRGRLLNKAEAEEARAIIDGQAQRSGG